MDMRSASGPASEENNPPPSDGCETSDDCNFGVCCKQDDGSQQCQGLCGGCASGADCVDLGCCTTGLGSACAPENLCFGGSWDPAP